LFGGAILLTPFLLGLYWVMEGASNARTITLGNKSLYAYGISFLVILYFLITVGKPTKDAIVHKELSKP